MKILLNENIKMKIVSITKKHSLPTVFINVIYTLIIGEKTRKSIVDRVNDFKELGDFKVTNEFLQLRKELSIKYPYVANFLKTKVFEEDILQKKIALMEGIIYLFHNSKTDKVTYAILEVIDVVDTLTSSFWGYFYLAEEATHKSCQQEYFGPR